MNVVLFQLYTEIFSTSYFRFNFITYCCNLVTDNRMSTYNNALL